MVDKKKSYQITTEDLEDTVRLVDPGFWLGLTAVVVTLVLAVVLSFFVEISEKISSVGVLLDKNGPYLML